MINKMCLCVIKVVKLVDFIIIKLIAKNSKLRRIKSNLVREKIKIKLS